MVQHRLVRQKAHPVTQVSRTRQRGTPTIAQTKEAQFSFTSYGGTLCHPRQIASHELSTRCATGCAGTLSSESESRSCRQGGTSVPDTGEGPAVVEAHLLAMERMILRLKVLQL